MTQSITATGLATHIKALHGNSPLYKAVEDRLQEAIQARQDVTSVRSAAYPKCLKWAMSKAFNGKLKPLTPLSLLQGEPLQFLIASFALARY